MPRPMLKLALVLGLLAAAAGRLTGPAAPVHAMAATQSPISATPPVISGVPFSITVTALDGANDVDPTTAPAPVAAAPARAITPPSTGDAGLVQSDDDSLTLASIARDVAGILAVPALLLIAVNIRRRRRLAARERAENEAGG